MYKRQGFQRVMKDKQNAPDQRNGKNDPERNQPRAGVFVGKGGFVHIFHMLPVSYTHLDVYKRQTLIKILFRSSIFSFQGTCRKTLWVPPSLGEPRGGLKWTRTKMCIRDSFHAAPCQRHRHDNSGGRQNNYLFLHWLVYPS